MVRLVLALAGVATMAAAVAAQPVTWHERAVEVVVPLTAGYFPDCDRSGSLDFRDFVCFVQKYAVGDPYANCDGSLQSPALNVADFACFVRSFAAGPRNPIVVTVGAINLQTLPHAYNEPPVLVEYTVHDDHEGNAFAVDPAVNAAWCADPVARVCVFSVGADATGTLTFTHNFPCFTYHANGAGRWVIELHN